MKCKLCGNKKTSNNARSGECWTRWQICGNCYYEIKGDYRKTAGNAKTKKNGDRSYCAFCWGPLAHNENAKNDFCSNRCRGLWYRREQKARKGRQLWAGIVEYAKTYLKKKDKKNEKGVKSLNAS